MKNLIALFLLVIAIQMQNFAQVSFPLLQTQSKTDTSKINPTQFSLSAGAFVMGNKQNALYGSYVTPMVRLNSDKRFSYGFGASISTSNINSNFINTGNETQILSIQPRIRNTVFVFGSYQVSEKFQINGSYYQDVSPNAISFNKANSNSLNQSAKGVNLSLIFNATEHSSFQFDFNYSTGNQGFYPYNMNTRSNFNQVPSNYFFH